MEDKREIYSQGLLVVLPMLDISCRCYCNWSAFTEGETPVPIPNTEVKPLRADGSVFVRICESRSVLLKLKGSLLKRALFIAVPF